MSRQTIATIDLTALRQNFSYIASQSPDSSHIAVIKADAYGNGSIAVAKALSDQASMLAVAFMEEATHLRQAGITLPILVLEGPNQKDELKYTSSMNLHWMLHNRIQLDWFNEFLLTQPIDGYQWIKLDSGMHRLGLPVEEFQSLSQEYPKIFSKHAVIATHLACADELSDFERREHAQVQLNNFFSCVPKDEFRLSIANSAASMALRSARQDFNRIGIAAFGASPFELQPYPVSLKPVMTLSASVIALRTVKAGESVGYGASWTATRESQIATVSIGYADGYPRHAPSGTPAFVNGARISLAGRVSMDMLTFDVTDVENIQIGDVVELWGSNISINEVADYVGTIGYELMTRVSLRVPRVYKDIQEHKDERND